MELRKKQYGMLALFLVATAALSVVQRDQFWLLIGLMSLSFLLYTGVFDVMKKWGLGLGIFFVVIIRVAFFFELPLLSEDFYRFIWDGMLMNEGLTSIGNIPNQIDVSKLSNPVFAEVLLQEMNSAQYPSIYPPLHQLISGGAFFFGQESILGSVNALRIFILIFEIMFLVYVSLCANSMMRYALFYLMNPLVIVEGVGNVHIEALLVPLLGIALLEMVRRKPVQSAIAWVGSVLVKFIPLILAPMMFFRFTKNQRGLFVGASILTGLVLIMFFQPMEMLNAFMDGMGIYYGIFEFNASFYYLVRGVATAFVGYNPIAILAPVMGVTILLVILWVSYAKRKANTMELALVVYLIYMLGTATVHPWYIIPIVMLATFSNRYYVLVWSGLVFLSYSHYQGDLGPKWGFLFVEYAGLATALILESRKERWLQSAFRG